MFLLRHNVLAAVFIFSFFNSPGQLKYYAGPLKIPASLSGNFGELRPDHFHMGVDFKTRQRSGLPVHSAAKGHVARIVVSPAGYGKALYIEHPNGTTTVYGHLQNFREDIEKYVRAEQYKRQSFAVDIGVSSGKFPVERDDQIGLSGNSGSSAGPHLHFEIRDTETQDALNPLKIQDFNVKDALSPGIEAVQLYPLSDRSHVDGGTVRKSWPVKLSGKVYQISPAATIRAYGDIGIAVKSNDYSEVNGSPCGVYSVACMVDGEKTFSYSFDRIPFGQGHCLKSHIDYEEFVRNKKYFQKQWREKGNRFHIYETGKDRGILKIDSGKVYLCEILISDEAGNQSKLSFRILGKYDGKPSEKTEPELIFSYDSRNRMENEEFELYAPNGAFYEDFPFTWSVSKVSPVSPGFYSGIHRVHSNTIPIHKAIKIRLLTKGLPPGLTNKAFVTNIGSDGKKQFVGGKYDNGWMETEIAEFGNYAVACDTVPPKIVPVGIKNNALTETGRIRFTISDDLSGIKSYRGFIDDNWALFEYDPKTRSLVYFIDPERITIGKRHKLELTVADRVDNIAVFRATFWK